MRCPALRARPYNQAGMLEAFNKPALNPYKRRHSRWYEVLLFSVAFQLLVGAAATIVLPAMLVWGPAFARHLDPVHTHWPWATGAGFVAIFFLPVATCIYLPAFALLLFLRSSYSHTGSPGTNDRGGWPKRVQTLGFLPQRAHVQPGAPGQPRLPARVCAGSVAAESGGDRSSDPAWRGKKQRYQT